jgi:hypothetical protein
MNNCRTFRLSPTLKAILAAASFLPVAGFSTFLSAAKIPTNLNDNVLTCGTNARCSNKVMFGRNYKVMQTAKFTVMVSISTEGSYTRADVSVQNNGSYSQNLSPQDFRVDVISPKPRVLLYVAPADLQLPPPKPLPVVVPIVKKIEPPKTKPMLLQAAYVTQAGSVQEEVADTAATKPPTAPTIDELYQAAKLEAVLKEAAEKAAAEKHLEAATIPANEIVRGRVYFERDHKAKMVNVVLPVAGQVFEFPYSMEF